MLEIIINATVSNHYIVFTTYYSHGIGRCVPSLKIFFRHIYLHTFGLASLYTYTLEASK